MRAIIVKSEWIQNIVKSGGIYKKNGNNIVTFKKSNMNELKYYIGTYFLRSLTHSFTVYDNLLKKTPLKDIFGKKNKIRILNIGSGAAGEFFGMMIAFLNNEVKPDNIHVDLIDANVNMKKLFTDISQKYNNNIDLNWTYNYIIEDLNEKHKFSDGLKELKGKLNNKKYDIILCFNMINELYRMKNNEKNYKLFLSEMSKLLNDDGMIFLSDVTDKVVYNGIDEFLPIIMNRECNEFFKENKGFSPILPIPCSLYVEECIGQSVDCFTQEHYSIYFNNSKNVYDNFKVNFKIITKTHISEKIKPFIIKNWKAYEIADTAYSYNVCNCGVAKKYPDKKYDYPNAFII